MKVLLVCRSKLIENLGVMYLSAVVKQAGHECRVVDLDNAVMFARAWRPDVVGYSIMTGSQGEFADVNRQIKCSLVFAGGPHPSFFPDDPALGGMNVVQGEGEGYFADILGSQIKYPAIDSIPWPDRTDFPERRIRDFIASRGCPYDCAYCYNQKWAELCNAPRVRTRDVKYLCLEVEQVNPEFAYFQDSCFGLNQRWMEKFATLYCGIPYHCHLRPSQVTREMASLLKSSGCHSIRMALESASTRLRKLMNRPALDDNNVQSATYFLKDNGIRFMIQNIMGLPTGTIDDDLETLEFNIRCKPDYGWVSIYAPYPGTVLGDYCKKEGFYTGDYSDIGENFFDKSVLNFDPEYKEQLEVLQKVFALCVECGYLPDKTELTHFNLSKLVHKVMRKRGDERLYAG
jgi:anaerobic magnesium-protoporphyrin IX monomethyl ester cyclase